VRNTGSSIPAERTRLVFDAFTKLKASQRSGLGLSVCRRIAQRHSGRIWIESGADHVHVLITLTGSES
jgi:signal transduction histidine kinase